MAFSMDDPWEWTKNKGPMSAPLGATIQASQEQQAGPAPAAQPGTEDKLIGAAKDGLLKEGLKSAEAGMAAPLSAEAMGTMLVPEGASALSGAGSQAATLAAQDSLMGSGASALTTKAAEGALGGASAAGSSMLGPLGAAAGGIAEGNYGKAVGSAVGAAAGNAVIPVIGGFIGSQLGGYIGGGGGK